MPPTTGFVTDDTLAAEPAAGLRLPHERDEQADPAGSSSAGGHARVHQAARDLARGLVDTDLRATPGQDAERREWLLRQAARDGS